MERNVGGADRAARAGLGILAAVAGVSVLALSVAPPLLGVVLLAVGAVLSATAAVRWCPVSQAC